MHYEIRKIEMMRVNERFYKSLPLNLEHKTDMYNLQ